MTFIRMEEKKRKQFVVWQPAMENETDLDQTEGFKLSRWHVSDYDWKRHVCGPKPRVRQGKEMGSDRWGPQEGRCQPIGFLAKLKLVII